MSGVAEKLMAGAQTFREKNAQYGDSFNNFAYVMAALFPNGMPDVKGINSVNRMGVFSHVVEKVMRYAAAWNEGGHRDSAHDLMVYAAMLEELTK